MFKIDVKHNFPEISSALSKAQSQVPFALARALTKTGQDVKAGQRQEIDRVFDRPTNYTRNSVYLRTATKQRLQAEVWLKWGARPDHYLLPQIVGGDRPLKRFEQRLVKAGYMQASERAVPGEGARLDQFGNLSRGQIVQILSQLKTAAVVGDYSDATNSRRSRAKREREGYFVSRGPGAWQGKGSWKNGRKSQHLPRGIWVRRSFGTLGTAIKPVLLFVPRVHYRPIYPFFEVADRIVQQRFRFHFNESWQIALKTALPRNQLNLFP